MKSRCESGENCNCETRSKSEISKVAGDNCLKRTSEFTVTEKLIFDNVDNHLCKRFKDDVSKKDNPDTAQKHSIQNLVREYQNGNKDVFDEIFEIYKNKIKTKAKNDEDFMQEIFIELLKALDTYDFGRNTKFNTYFWTLANNCMARLYNNSRAQKRFNKFGSISANQPIITNDSEVTVGDFIEDKSVCDDFDQAEFRATMVKSIYPLLKDSDIKALEMIGNDYTYEEVAKVLNRTAPAIHNKMRRMANKKNVGRQLRELYDIV